MLRGKFPGCSYLMVSAVGGHPRNFHHLTDTISIQYLRVLQSDPGDLLAFSVERSVRFGAIFLVGGYKLLTKEIVCQMAHGDLFSLGSRL
jgi:hypothetical protein